MPIRAARLPPSGVALAWACAGGSPRAEANARRGRRRPLREGRPTQCSGQVFRLWAPPDRLPRPIGAQWLSDPAAACPSRRRVRGGLQPHFPFHPGHSRGTRCSFSITEAPRLSTREGHEPGTGPHRPRTGNCPHTRAALGGGVPGARGAECNLVERREFCLSQESDPCTGPGRAGGWWVNRTAVPTATAGDLRRRTRRRSRPASCSPTRTPRPCASRTSSPGTSGGPARRGGASPASCPRSA